jgi:EAL domain-containing protein (putative c-di-GMP-specific phosphodiesterase class I)/AmiR/NasT family two-component response regulator
MTMRILLVDDDAFALKLVRHQLGQLGYTSVEAFADPHEALVRLEGDPSTVDMILLDLQMPGIDGIEFVRHLARINFAGGVALLSGEDDRILQTAFRLASAHRLSVRGALHKPVTPGQLEVLLGASNTAPARRASGATRKHYTAERLKEAIEAHELTNVYQPKVELATGRVRGVETLVRWQHPEDGLVFPDQFIALAEENGLIDALTRLVLKNAIAQAHIWEAAGLSLHVGVNVSMENLSDLNFPDFVAEALSVAGTSHESLVLEVTESRLMTNVISALDILTRLRLKHIGLSIDDFGTGHSSLAQLRDIPFDELKVDRGFVHGAADDAAKHAILEASLAMAKQLGMTTVGEGVEDRADWTSLRDSGCTLAQGYFVARPMPAGAFPKWLEEWQARVPELIGG